jgi:hypothetical protein
MHLAWLTESYRKVNRRNLGVSPAAPQTASLTAVAILPLLQKRHARLKNLKVHVASIDFKPSPDSIWGANLACVLYRSGSDK